MPPCLVLNIFPSGPRTLPKPTCTASVPGEPAGQAGGGKNHLEVLRLGQAHHVHEQVGPQAPDAVPDRRQVGGGIVVAADGVLHDERQRLALAVGEPGREDAKGALALHQEALFGKVVDDPGQERVVIALPHHVVPGQFGAQPAQGLSSK